MSIISDTKEIVELIQKVDNADLYRKIIDLQGEIYEMHGANMELKEKVRELEQQLIIVRELDFNEQDGYYYKEGEPVPYCSTCWENDRKAIHLTKVGADYGGGHNCEVCGINQMAARGGN